MSKVSVIIPCYNHASYLGETIESVLAQTHPATEIIVVDDGSHDASAEVAARYAAAHPTVCLIQQANAGRSAAANHGLRESSGDYLVFLDADDRLLPHALATGLGHLDTYPDAAFAAGHCVYIDASGLRLETYRQPLVTKNHYERLLQGNFILNPGNVVFRRWAVEAVGGFDTTLKHAEDYSIYLRIARSHPMVSYAEVVAVYRQHPNNKSKNAHTMLRTVLSILEAERATAERTLETRQALNAGIQYTKKLFGERCVTQFWANLEPQGDRQRAWATFKTILSFYPTGFPRYFKRRVQANLKVHLTKHRSS